MNIALWIVQIILGVAFILAGTMKSLQYEKAKASMPWVKDTAKGLVIFIGLVEILGGLGLIMPYVTGIFPILTPIAAIGLGVIMILAAGLHIKRKENQAVVMNTLFLALALFVVIGRW